MSTSRERGAVVPHEEIQEPEVHESKFMNEEDIPVESHQAGLNVDPNDFWVNLDDGEDNNILSEPNDADSVESEPLWKNLDENDDTLPKFDPKTGKLT